MERAGQGSSLPVRLPNDHPQKGCIYRANKWGFEVKYMFASVQFGVSHIPILLCLDIFKEPGLGGLASSPGFHSGGQPSLELEGMQGKIYSSWYPDPQGQF